MAKRKSLHMPIESSVTNGSNEKCIWNTAMEDVLVGAYVHQHNMGNRQGGTFTSTALDNILKEMREHFPSKQFDKQKIKDHMKRLKNKFTPCYDLFKNGLSGFGWDPIMKVWTAEPEVWEKLIEAKPEAAVWKNKQVPYYDKMLILYGQDRATGEYAETASEMRQKTSLGADFETIIDIDQLVSNNEVTLEGFDAYSNEPDCEESLGVHSQSASQGPTLPKNKKRKMKETNNDMGVEVFAKSLDNIVEAFVKCSADLVKCHQTRVMTENEVWTLVKGLEVEKDMINKAYYFLICDTDAQRALIGCPPEERKQMLMFLMSTTNGPRTN